MTILPYNMLTLNPFSKIGKASDDRTCKTNFESGIQQHPKKEGDKRIVTLYPSPVW